MGVLMDKKELLKKVELRLQNYKFLEMQINNIELDIKKEKMEYRGCGAINYYERTGTTNNISRTVENEVIAKEKKIEKLMHFLFFVFQFPYLTYIALISLFFSL